MKYVRAPFGMSLSKERNLDENLILRVSTQMTYDSNSAYHNSVVPKIPTKVHMKRGDRATRASQEDLHPINVDISSPLRKDKKRLNVPKFSRMTGRSARSIMQLKTEASPNEREIDRQKLYELKQERLKYLKMMEYAFVRNKSMAHIKKPNLIEQYIAP